MTFCMWIRRKMLRLTLTFLAIQMVAAQIEGDFEVLIFHTNNMHGRFLERARDGGDKIEDFARVSYLLKQARDAGNGSKGPTVLYLNVGGVYVDNFLFSVHKSKLAAELTNVLQPNATCLGNHDFNFGVGELSKFAKDVKTPVIASNIVFNNETTLKELIRVSTTITVHNKRIAIVAFVDEDSQTIHNLGNLKVTDAVQALKTVSKELTKTGVHIIIALGHRTNDTDLKVAQYVQGVDLVFAGHSHMLSWDRTSEGDTLETIARAGKVVPIVHTKYLGKLLLTFDGKGNLRTYKEEPIVIRDTIPQDKRMLDLMRKYRSDIAKRKEKAIGKSCVFLKGSSCGNEECNLGNLIADAFVWHRIWAYRGTNWTDSTIALINAGGIRGDIKPAPKTKDVTLSDIVRVLPFVQFLYIIQITGKDLLDTLEFCVSSKGEALTGHFLVVSGLKVVYNIAQPIGSRVQSVHVRCTVCKIPAYEPLKNQTIYRVLTIQHLVQGGDGHDVIKRAALSCTKLPKTNVDAVLEYMRAETIVLPEIEERVTFVQEERSLTSELSEHLFLPVVLAINTVFL